MWLRRFFSTSSAGVSPRPLAVLYSYHDSSFFTAMQRFLFLFFDRPIRGKVVGIHVIDISSVCGGVTLVLGEEGVGIQHCCGLNIVTLKGVILQVIHQQRVFTLFHSP